VSIKDGKKLKLLSNSKVLSAYKLSSSQKVLFSAIIIIAMIEKINRGKNSAFFIFIFIYIFIIKLF
jgi:hypothetical protein